MSSGIIRTTYEIITEESARDGEVAERGWKDEVGYSLTVEEAIRKLCGCEPSSSEFHTGIWYTSYGDMDLYTGDYENESYHLKCFSEQDERAIYNGVTQKGRR
jgi:hypothetical protein